MGTKDKSFDDSYNERLFSGSGLRSYFHNSRFNWFSRVIDREKISTQSIIEIGCFDGRLLDHMNPQPDQYVGFDAGWEGGIEIAQEAFKNQDKWEFIKSETSDDLLEISENNFGAAVSMETIEHIPPEFVDGYLEQLQRVTNGYLLVTVPNEKGPLFLAKWLAKKVWYGAADKYSFSELIAATLGQTHKVERDEHKGFDYDRLVEQISKYFTISKVEAIPFGILPLWMSFTVGIIAKSKKSG